jgi:putative endonuclease
LILRPIQPYRLFSELCRTDQFVQQFFNRRERDRRHCEPKAKQSRKANRVKKLPCVYIMANKRNGPLYTGVTSNLSRRVYEHREGLIPGFTTRYSCKILVWYERYERMDEAIGREKQLKAGSRKKKPALIEAMNPQWCDFYEHLA